MSWNWPNWEQLRALAYSVNSYHLWAITAHTKLSVSLTIKICWFFGWFLNLSTFADLPLNEFLKFVYRISFLVIGNNIHMTYTLVSRWYWCSAKNMTMRRGETRLLAIVSVMEMNLQVWCMFRHKCKKCSNFLYRNFSKFWRLRKKVSWLQLFVYIFSKKM